MAIQRWLKHREQTVVAPGSCNALFDSVISFLKGVRPGFSGADLIRHGAKFGGIQTDVDRCQEVSRCVGFNSSLTLQLHFNGVPYCLADVGDRDIGVVHPFGVVMPE